MKKISYCLLIFLLAFQMVLISYNVNQVSAASPEEVTFWWWGGQESPGFEDYLNESIKKYQEANPDVEINQLLQPTDNLIPAFKAAAAASSGPDIATLWYGVYQLEHIWSGDIIPIDNYIDKEETDHWISKELSTYDGKLWGGPLYGYGNIMVYNKTLFKKAGLDPENPPVTWEEFLDVSKKLKEAGIDPLSVGFKDPGWEFAVLSCHFWPQTLESRDAIKEAVIGERSFTDEGFTDMWYRLNELREKDYFIEGAMSISLEEAYAEVVKENAAFALINTQLALEWYDEYGSDEIGFMSFPSVTEEPVDWVPVTPITLFVTEWSQNKETSADFIEYLHNEERMEALVDINSFQADDRFPIEKIKDPNKQFVFRQIKRGFEEGNWFTDSLIPYSIIGDGLLPAGQKLIMGMIGPEEAAQIVEDAAISWRKLHPERLKNYKNWINN